MINTIFYFADTQQEYLDNYAQGSVKPHTICFAKDTKTVWRDGQRFSGMLQNEVDDEIRQLTDQAFIDLNEIVQNLEAGLNTATQAAAEEKIRLDGLMSALDDEISDVAANLTNTAAAIRNEVRNGELYTSEGWDPKVNAYLKTVGLWDYGTGDTQHVTKWSTLRQSVSDVSSEVNRVETKADGYNNTLQSKINQEVTDRGEAITNLGNTYARITDVDGVKDVIEWMYSGLKSSSSANKTYAEIVASGKNGLSSAISDLRTSVDSLGSTYVAQSSLTSSVDNAISGIINAASGTYANTSVFSKIDENSDNIAAIATKVTGDSSQSTVAAKLNGMTASLVTTANLDSSIAALSAQAKDTVGNAIAATIFAKANEQGSNITLNADKIYLAGQTWAQYINALGITANQLRVTDGNGVIISELRSNGTAQFMNNRIQIPYWSAPMSGGELSNETGVVVKSKDGSQKCFYQHDSIGIQSATGIISSGIFGSKAGESGSTLSITNYGSTANTANYRERIGISMSRGFQTSDANGVGYFAVSNLNSDNGNSMTGKAEIVGWDIIQLYANNVKTNVPVAISSDERLKTIISDVSPKTEDIARARTVDFYYNNDSGKHIRTGSIAQDWQKIIPNVVHENEDGTLNLEYASAALVSVVSVAKELVALKKENEELKQRLADIESKLIII